MANTAAYEASSLDWTALSALAKRAAQETPLIPDPRIVYFDRATNANIDVLGPHWVLDCRFQNADDKRNPHRIEEDHIDDIYALLPSGELMYVQVVDECCIFGLGTRPTFKDHHTARKMTDSDVQVFDFAEKYYEFGPPDSRVWGTAISGSSGRGDLLHDAKGAGLTLLLEALRTGQAKLPLGPSRFHTAKELTKPRIETQQPARGALVSSEHRAGILRRPIVLAGIVALVVAAVLLFTLRDKPKQSAQGPITNPITTARQVVDHATIPAAAINDAIRGMGLGSCWNGRWSWNNAENSYMPVAVPVTVDCSSPDATQQLDMVSDDCRGSAAQMDLTQRARFDGQAHCLLLVPSEGMCLPLTRNGDRENYTGIPVVCDTPPSPRYPSLMHLAGRLNNENEACNTADGHYYTWFEAVNAGFCYTLMG